MNSLLLLATGFVFGLKHALEADHLIAINAVVGLSGIALGASIIFESYKML